MSEGFRVEAIAADDVEGLLHTVLPSASKAAMVLARGRSERVDAVIDDPEVVQDVTRQFGATTGLYVPLVAGGFSFGSVMSLMVGCREPRVRAILAMGVPILHVPDTSFLNSCAKPRLFIQGENDEFGDRARIEALVAPLPEPKSVAVIPASDHYFTGHLDELHELVTAWARTEPWA